MPDTSVTLLVAGTVLLVGFAASLAFQKFRIPDFLLLILLGAGLGAIPMAPFGTSLVKSLQAVLPIFLQLTIAFILFEGGLSLKTRQAGRALGPLLLHVVVAFLATFAVLYLIASRLFGLSEVASLILAIAMANPSASIALSFAPRMRLSERAEAGVILEGVITNVFAVMGILYVLQWAGATAQVSLPAYGIETAGTIGFALVAGGLWRYVARRLHGRDYLHIAGVGVAIIVYGTAQMLLAQNGALAVFLFGLVLGYHRPATVGEDIDDFVGEFSRPVDHLRRFQSEITFALRTFFFLYLGLLLVSEWAGFAPVVYGALLVVAFILGRLPSSLAVGRALHLPKREQRVLVASIGRGLTDVILILLAVQAGVLPQTDANFMLSILPSAVLLSAIVCAGLLVWAGRTPLPAPVPGRPVPASADRGGPPPPAAVRALVPPTAPKPPEPAMPFIPPGRGDFSRRARPPGPRP